MEHQSFTTIQLFDTSERQRIDELKIKAVEYDNQIPLLTDKKTIKDSKRMSCQLKSQANSELLKHEEIMANLIYERLVRLDKTKGSQGYICDQSDLDEVKNLYLLLTKQGRWNVRYSKLPKNWLRLGTSAGVLEELVVIFRTAGNEGFHPNHLFTVSDLHRTIIEYNKKSRLRFLFITKLYEQLPEDEIEFVLLQLIQFFQEPSFRIGILQEPYLEWRNRMYFYAIQGVYGDITLDNRVVKIVSNDGFEIVNGKKSDVQVRRYAVHFTRKPFAQCIWDSVNVTNAIKKRDKDIAPGSIAKFQRSIHALTCVSMINNVLVIDEDKACIRDRMVHGINDTVKRTKYEAGLVIDIHKLAGILNEGCVMINELGTLLVNDDIPRSCIVDLIVTDEQLNQFWRIANK